MEEKDRMAGLGACALAEEGMANLTCLVIEGARKRRNSENVMMCFVDCVCA